MSKFSESNF